MTLDIILRQGVVSLWGWSMGVPSEVLWVHPGLSMPCTCYPNIIRLGCRLIAWCLCRPPC